MADLNDNSICLLPPSYWYKYVARPVYACKLPSPTSLLQEASDTRAECCGD